MSTGSWLTILGLVLNTVASVLVIIPLLAKHNIDDDYIVDSDEATGNYKQRKHIKERRFGIIGFLLFALGFILQIIGILIEAHKQP